MKQQQCHPGDSQRGSLDTRDLLLCLGMATSHLMAALNLAWSFGNCLCPKQSHSGMAWAFGNHTEQPVDGDGKMPGPQDGRFQPLCWASRSQRQDTCMTLTLHAGDAAGQITYSSLCWKPPCSQLAWPSIACDLKSLLSLSGGRKARPSTSCLTENICTGC